LMLAFFYFSAVNLFFSLPLLASACELPYVVLMSPYLDWLASFLSGNIFSWICFARAKSQTRWMLHLGALALAGSVLRFLPMIPLGYLAFAPLGGIGAVLVPSVVAASVITAGRPISHPVWSHHVPGAFPCSQTMWNTISSETVLSFRLVYDGVPRPRPSFPNRSQSKPSCSLHVLGFVQMGTKNGILSVDPSSLLDLPLHLTCSTGIAAHIAEKDQMDYGRGFSGLDDSPSIGWNLILRLEGGRIVCAHHSRRTL